MGMIIVFTGFVRIFSDAGFGAALIQRKELEERHRSSVFWLNIGIGCAITALLMGGAPWIAWFYDEPILTPLTMFIAVEFVIESLNSVQLALFRRDMDFKSITLIDVCSKIGAGGIGIGMALTGFGVWSLAARSVMATASSAAVVWAMSPWWPRFQFEWGAIQDLLEYSANLLGFSLINYWTRNADNLLIGRLVGSAGLGVYTRAYGTMLLPIRQITSVLSNVMFPALSRIQDDIERVKRIYLRSHRVIGLIAIPMMCGLFVVAEPFVLTLFGPKWEAMVPVLQILCFVGVKQPLGSTTGWIFQSQGRTDLMFKWNIVVSTMTIASFVIGVNWGVIGVAIGYTLRGYILWYHAITIPGSLINLSFSEFLWNVSGIAACAVSMSALVYGLGFLLPANWAPWTQLATQVPFGIAVYWGLIHGLDLQGYRETLDLLVEQWNKRTGAATP
jgi:PST family polysaccharide transporter